MKHLLAWIFALASGLYLLIMGPMIGPLDPVPIIDEALALAVFVKSMAFLGYDVRRYLPFLRKGRPKGKPTRQQTRSAPIDI